jgi:hypothetical protein
MPNPATNSGIRHNHKRSVGADYLKARIRFGSRLSVVSVYFTIYAYDALREHLDQIDDLDFLLARVLFALAEPERASRPHYMARSRRQCSAPCCPSPPH